MQGVTEAFLAWSHPLTGSAVPRKVYQPTYVSQRGTEVSEK